MVGAAREGTSNDTNGDADEEEVEVAGCEHVFDFL